MTARALSSFLFASFAALNAQDPPVGPPGGGFPGGPGGPGGMGQSLQVKERFDADKNGRLDAEERKAARAWVKENRPQRGRRGGGPGGPGGFGGPPGGDAPRDGGQPKVGGRVSPADVPNHDGKPLFDPSIVRTWFLELPGDDWFAELTDFYRTDVALPAKLTVDGKTFADVGVQFRGNTSFGMAPGKKKSLDLQFDFVDEKQSVLGVRNLDLLNCNTDASSLREMVHGWLADRYFPAPRVALARVVVNGEDYGVYAAVQQFDKDFLEDHFGSKKGDRFKVPPDFSGGGGLRYLGEDPQAYRRNYELKSGENEQAWRGLVDACAALEQAPADRLEAILPQHLDIDAALWFLAMDNAVGDDDGYFSRASDYVLYRDPKGRLHPIPRDNNEILLGARGRGPGGPGGAGGPGAPGGGAGGPPGERRPPDAPPGGDLPGAGPGGPPPTGPGAGPGGRRGPGGGGTATTPLQGASRADRPLLHKLLSVPAWQKRYLANLREIATVGMSDDVLGAQLTAWRRLLEPLVEVDVHSLYGLDAFRAAFATDDAGKPAARSLMAIVAARRKAILDDASMQGPWPELAPPVTTARLQNDGTHVLHMTAKATGARAATVRLHHDQGQFGAYATMAMADDGQHGDGHAGDGVFGASLPPVEAGTTVRYWLEAVAAGSDNVDCQPPGNGAKPFVWVAPGKGKR